MEHIWNLWWCLFVYLFWNNGWIDGSPQGKQSRFNFRLDRSLPSVSDDHFQESASDGSYRYAYTGKGSYHAEKRSADGIVEGETLYLRSDGVPIKVHYFADAKSGYRPTTEILYEEKLRSPEVSTVVSPTPRAHAIPLHNTPSVYLAPPLHSVVVPEEVPNQVNAVVEGNHIFIGNNLRSLDNVAISSPSITAIIGPGGRAEVRPHSSASTGTLRGGGVAISNPASTVVVGPGGTAVVAPTSSASTGGTNYDATTDTLVVPREPKVIWTPVDPVVDALSPVYGKRSHDVQIVPSQPGYEYTYTYSSPDRHYPLRDSSAFVNVRVNQ